MREINIAGRLVSEKSDPLVIAEIGINHGGSISVAKQMVDEAFKAGVEIVKIQTHVIEDEMSKTAKDIIPGNSTDSIYSIMESCALTLNEEIELKAYIEKKGLIFMSTPFSRAAADRLNDIGVKCFKIGSGECNNLPLIKHIAAFGKPMIVSTGMNNLMSVKETVSILKDAKVDFALLHTTNLYPTPPELVRLGALDELMDEFPDIVIGLSDHTTSNLACYAAVAKGALILERHFTDHKNRKGPDIINSMDPIELKELLISSSEIKRMLGGVKEMAKEEQVTVDFAFATVVSIKKIKKGDTLSEKNIWVKRPGVGEIKARDYESVIGKKAIVDIDVDEHIKWDDFK